MDISQLIPQANPSTIPKQPAVSADAKESANWGIPLVLGSIEGVSEAVRKLDTIPDHWKTAILAELAGIKAPFNFVRLDAHCFYHDGQTVLHFHLVPSKATL